MIDLEKDWKRYALQTPDTMFPLDEKFDECRGKTELGVVFKVAGLDGTQPNHYAVLTVDEQNVVRDWGTAGYGARVGKLLEMPTEIK